MNEDLQNDHWCSRWDRYLGMTAAMTQVPVPTATPSSSSRPLPFHLLTNLIAPFFLSSIFKVAIFDQITCNTQVVVYDLFLYYPLTFPSYPLSVL